jgi:hypothetical protein
MRPRARPGLSFHGVDERISEPAERNQGPPRSRRLDQRPAGIADRANRASLVVGPAGEIEPEAVLALSVGLNSAGGNVLDGPRRVVARHQPRH